ncbi:MAG: T9SS type A sorting domain-containing protein [Flavobacteriales bacterium]
MHRLTQKGQFCWLQSLRNVIALATLLLSPVCLKSQVNISGTINEQTNVLNVIQPNCSDCDPTCRDTIEVADASAFEIGDRVLIIQMKGASINTTNTSSGGQITSIGNAGNYEFFIIDTVIAASDFIIPRFSLIKDYDETGQVQVIRIPNYGNETVTVTGTLTAPIWDEATGVGGVVALVAKKLILNANIDVIGTGFQGSQMLVNGTPDNCSITPSTAYTLASTATQSYTKGEGIVADNTSVNRGRAPRANGGGSGISGDSGGGGGSSYGAGGVGGKRWCDVSGAVAGGLGGVSLQTYFLQDKLFLGGAGGAGFVTTNNPSTSTDGGGIVILFVDTLVGNGFSILADGTSPTAVVPVGAPDGGGGGGGGGCVLLNVISIQGNLTVSANGGDGQDLNTNIYHGPGGGGGGGVLLYSLPTLPGNVTFGAIGGTGGQHLDGFRNASGDGSNGGTFGLYIPIENVNYRANVDNDPIPGVCDIDDDRDGIPDIAEIYSGDHDQDDTLDYLDANFCLDYFDGVNGWSCATDGLPNPTGDLDGDGYANFQDADFPYCGSFTLGVDKICSNFDPDGDGIPSHLDLDSDNDGIPDIIEAGGTDVDGDGQSESTVDIDEDGLVDIYDADVTDGPSGSSPCSPQPGCLENTSITILPLPDTDNDTIPDYLDTDSDNDGIPDVIEVGGTDANGDGRIDNYADADDDGFIDVLDYLICEDSIDFDTAVGSDSYVTYVAASSSGITNGSNVDGAPNGTFAQVYQKGDRLVLDLGQVFPIGTTYTIRWRQRSGESGTSFIQVEESTSPGSGYSTNSVSPSDNTEVFKNTVMTTEVATRYLRMREVASGDDFDIDAVTVSAGGVGHVSYNVYQVCLNGDPIIVTGADGNNDGIPESYPGNDYDGDGVLDYLDLDSDNDGIPDVVEAGGTDANGDGIADNYLDVDGDGFNDFVDGDPTNVLVLGDDSDGANSDNALHASGADNNGDGRPDSIVEDDSDGDGLPSFYDLDSDADGITDVIEAGGTDANTDGLIDGNATDTDGDGFADGVDGDVGNDGTSENTANALVLTGADANNDGAPDSYTTGNSDDDLLPNFLDIDSDNDGIVDNTEAQATSSYIAPSGSDTDGDGIDNAYDPSNGGTYTSPVDTDNDGDDDYVDIDSDDDTYPDLIEGHDMDGDGFPDASSPAGIGVSGGTTDADGDGLYDGWDNNTASTDATNSGLDPADHPDVHNPGADRDWRDPNDTDGDGVADHLDYDDDNDGILDVDESGGADPNGNEDGDEYPNWLDTVDDGNGGDGSTTDYTDADGNGIPDIFDIDGDGIPNHIDLDSDNDGITDLAENPDGSGVDANNDGVVDGNSDADGDGVLTSADSDDTVVGSAGSAITDTDGDGIPDSQDLDSDNDGITDLAENTNGSGVDSNNDGVVDGSSDSDMDGILDSADSDDALRGSPGTAPADADGDGIANAIDLDSDNDGITDLAENPDGTGVDANNDGIVDGASDADGDGILDSADSDDAAFGSPSSSVTDTDGDGVPDSQDLDSDNDGLTDFSENPAGTGTDANNDGVVDGASDADGDGILDSADSNDGALGSPNSNPTDTDGDGLANAIDLDSDNDGITDLAENPDGTGTDANNDGVVDGAADADGDGILDSADSNDAAFGSAGSIPTDTDGDGIADANDLDSDNDGIPDLAEDTNATGTDANNDGVVDGAADADGDGILDSADNNDAAFGSAGSVPADSDNDGLANHIDIDSDNDGIPDFRENIGGTGTDANSDGIVDGASDADGDGILDSADSNDGAFGSPNSNATDTDGDGLANPYDIDSDDDGIVDNIEAQISTASTQPVGIDADADGLDNAFEGATTGLIPVDTDGDGTPDYLDTDSDDDGLLDILEAWDTDGDYMVNISPSNSDADGDGLDDNFDDLVGPNATTNPTNNGQTAGDFPDITTADLTAERDWREANDTDKDGVADNVDLDDDNDGIPDASEAGGNVPSGDEDGDGIPNWLDTTDDGNGGDGSTTSYTDANADGIPDVYDQDLDGIPNHLDKDSDNDGIVDIIEAGGTDADMDGEVDYATPGDASTMVDADNDGLFDAIDNINSGSGGGEVTGGTPLSLPNTDSQGPADFLDIDSDDDGIVDNTEAMATQFYSAPTGTDTDRDGIDDSYDPDNGGTYVTPVNTEGTGNPDYTDTNSDDDAETDAIEGHDSDGNGSADSGSPANTGVSGGTTDVDGDGLLDGYDNDTLSRDPTNGGLTPLSHPDQDAGPSERDWREAPCTGGAATLTAIDSTTLAGYVCQQSPWTYYYNPSDPTELLFAIEHMPVGGNTNEFTAEVSLTVSVDPDTEPGVYRSTDAGNGDATFVMGRYWNISITSGSLNGGINIRYYYDPNDADTMEAVANAWNAANANGTLFVSGRRWFMMTSGDFDPATGDLTPLGIAGSTELFPDSMDTEDGVNFVQFNDMSSVTGGTMAYTVGNNSVILPVELLEFKARLMHGNVWCEWRTASEVNSDYFDVERSTDQTGWEYLGRLGAAGNSNSTLQYFIADDSPYLGRSYYRLKSVDMDGSFEYSHIEVVEIDPKDKGAILIYPNPNDGRFTINFGQTDWSGEVRIVDAMGQLVRVQSINSTSSQQLELGHLPSGTYMLQLISNGSVSNHSVVIR